MEENVCDISFSQKVLRYDIKRTLHKKINKLDFNKIKNFCSVKDTVKRMKR